MYNNVINGKDAIEGMMKGVELATSMIRPTYGAQGSNVIVESKLRPYHMVANDAWTIIKGIKTEFPAQRIGLEFVKELCERQDKLSGDSRKTTIILLSELLNQGFNSDINKLELKRELDKLIPVVEEEIDKQTKQITVDEVANVATTAGESKELGLLLQEIYQKIGKNGIIQPEGSGTFETSYRFIDGVRFDMTGYLSPSFANVEKKAVYEKPLILVTKKKIATDDDINPLLSEIVNLPERRPLIIFTQDMDSNVASMLVDLHKKGVLNVCIIKAPTLWRDYIFEDFAKYTGATIIEDATGKNFKNMYVTDLGTCDKISIDEEETIIIGGSDISEHIKLLETKGDDDSKLRLSWLTNKTAILKLGANSETDLSYKLLKCYDAIRSSQLALKYGVVSGGGQCLARVANTLVIITGDTIASKILQSALVSPMYQIGINSGTTLTPDHVVDSAMVLKMAVRNAIGVASTILTANGIVYLLPEKEKEKNNEFFN